jgi:hypothetical protein
VKDVDDISRRDVIKLAATVGGASMLLGSTSLLAQDSQEKSEGREDKSLVYGNRPRWCWFDGHWWLTLDYDKRYPHGWDQRRRCGDTAEHYVQREAIRTWRIRGYCTQLPGRPPWVEVKLTGPVESRSGYAANAQSFTIEKADEVDFGTDGFEAPPLPAR